MEWIKFYDCNQENLNKVYADYIKKVDGDETQCICTNVLCVVPYTQPKINNGRPSEYIKTDYKMMTSTLLISWKDGAETINKKPYIQFNFGNISQSSIVKFARMEDINWGNVLNTIDVKEVQEPVNEDLEKYKEFVADELPQGSKLSPNGEFTIDVLKALIKDAVKLGAQWQREQMMKDAVEVKVFDDWKYGRDADLRTQPAIKLRCPELNIGQKAKVIIIKD